jgi:hypothetical protein
MGKKWGALAALCLLAGLAFAQNRGIFETLYGPDAEKMAQAFEPQLRSFAAPAAGAGELYVNIEAKANVTNALKATGIDRVASELKTETLAVDAALRSAMRLSFLERRPTEVPVVSFALLGIDSAAGSKSPLGYDFAKYTTTAGSPLILTGPCFKRRWAIAGGGVIRIACDPDSGEADKGWQTVKLTRNREARNAVPGGYVTGQAGFYTEAGKRRYFVELYSWPADPHATGG